MADAVRKIWRLLPQEGAAAARLATHLNVSPVLAQLLHNRGLGNIEEAERFLHAPLAGLRAPDELPGVAAAADHILQAVRSGRRICIYGDYDVDGVTGTAILLQALFLLDAAVHFYVPHRMEEGYGLNREALRQIAADGTSLVITVDCGIASLEEAEEAWRLGLDLIVTDHHESKATLPRATGLVHPRLPGCNYPFGGLSGAAVAFKLAWALAQRHCGGPKVDNRFKEFLLDAVALACLGVVADVVPLHDENRIIVRHGLHRLGTTPNLGVQALLRTANLEPGKVIRAGDVGYRIAPRINAAGRMGCARLAVDLLTTNRLEEATRIATYLEEANLNRQSLERRLLGDVRDRLRINGQSADPGLVIAGADWHPGILGIVASRLVDLYGRPTLMISLPNGRGPTGGPHEGLAVGSGRSVPGFALNDALQHCDDLLETHGGHRAAAGFRVRPERIDALREKFCDYVSKQFQGPPPPPVLAIDAEVPLSAMTVKLVKDLDKLEPHGAENRRPLFMGGNLQIAGEPRKVGQGERHLSFQVRQNGAGLKAIAFGMADRVDELMAGGGTCCLAFTPKINEWQGRRSVDLEVLDFQAGGQARLE